MSGSTDSMADQNQNQDETGWQNYAYDVYKKECGGEKFAERLKEFTKPPPAPGRFSSFRLYNLQIPAIKAFNKAKAFFSGRRAVHSSGVGGLGYATINRNPEIPDSEFFLPGKHFLVRVRHSNAAALDDADTGVKGIAIKFADSEEETPLDIIANTGAAGLFWNTESISFNAEFTRNIDNVKKVKEVFLKSPEHLRVLMEGFRRGPESYTDLRYHSQMPVEFISVDKVKRYARFRVIPADGRPETGRLTEEQQRKVWEIKRSKDDPRPADYLRSEFKTRLNNGPIKYTLQIQLHIANKDDPWYLFHPGRAWNELTHPWLDLADVTVTSLLPDDVIEGVRYNVGHVPSSSLALLPAVSGDDYRCINQIRQAVYPASQGARRDIAATEPLTSYTVVVETSAQLGAGTNSCIYMVFIGSKLVSKEVPLGAWFHNDYRSGHMDTYTVQSHDVGEVLGVRLVNKGWMFGADDWLVDKVTVTDADKKTYEFPCYRWVVDELVLYGGSAKLPYDDQPEVFRAFRGTEVQKRRAQYKWGSNKAPLNELPGYLEADTHSDIPRDSQFSDEAAKSFAKGVTRLLAKVGLSTLYKLGIPWIDTEEFEPIFTKIVEKEKLSTSINSNNCKDDHVFGMQFLNGVSPLVLERCERLPSNLALPEKLVDDLLDRGRNLSREMRDGHVYKADYSILEGISRYKQGSGDKQERFTCEPIALFYISQAGNLVPIAIQLHQQPGDGNPVWTPHDAPLDWLYAKMWLKNADLQAHQTIHHLLKTHLMMETFAVATWRQLPSLHPVYRLLFPHVRSIMAINTIARTELISEGGLVDQTLSIGGGGHVQIMQKFYKSFTWEVMDIPALLKRRGLDDATKLPGYHYRDDALSLWNATKTFIREFIAQFYKTDKEVMEDNEIQAWLRDVSVHGFPSYNAREDHRFPNMLRTRYQLVHLLTCVIFNCSCQHAAVNFGQLEMYAYMPNAPCCMHLAPPTTKGVVDMKTIMEALPTKQETAAFVGLMHILSQYAEDEKYLGDYSDGLLVDAHAHTIVDRFQAELRRISEAIRKRNEGLEWPYTYLLPERIPNSIAI